MPNSFCHFRRREKLGSHNLLYANVLLDYGCLLLNTDNTTKAAELYRVSFLHCYYYSLIEWLCILSTILAGWLHFDQSKVACIPFLKPFSGHPSKCIHQGRIINLAVNANLPLSVWVCTYFMFPPRQDC